MLVTPTLLSPLLVALAAPIQSPSAPGERMTSGFLELELALEDGPYRAALERLVPGTTAGPLEPAPWPDEWTEEAWSDGDGWDAWADALDRADDTARAQLARLAHLQGRWDDAWRHLAAIGDARTARAALPAILPGAPRESSEPGAAVADGLAQPLPDGVLLRPSLPPPGNELVNGGRVRRAVELAGVRVGDAILHLRVALEGDGVQIDFTHAGGGECRLQVIIPEPEGFEIRVEYVDWDRRSTVGEPHELVLRPGDEPHKLWGRFLRFPRPWPGRLPEHLPAQIQAAGLVVVDAPDAGATALLAGFAGALERTLGVPVHVTADRGSLPMPGFAPLRLYLGMRDERMDKLAAIASLVERRRFAHP